MYTNIRNLLLMRWFFSSEESKHTKYDSWCNAISLLRLMYQHRTNSLYTTASCFKVSVPFFKHSLSFCLCIKISPYLKDWKSSFPCQKHFNIQAHLQNNHHTQQMTSSHTLMNMVSLSLWFGGGPAEHLLHPPSLGHVGLEILGSVCYPGGVKLSGVLVHQVGVLSAAWATKVLHLKQSCNSKDNSLLCFHLSMCKAYVKF